MNELPPIAEQEEYDPAYLRLNSMSKLIAHCDSIYNSGTSTLPYAEVVSSVMRKRFYHGYSYYGTGHNVFAKWIEPMLMEGISAIVIPEDIMKYPHAACSQQSIVAMEIFKSKGYPVRKITMFDTESQVGHFIFEVYYNNSWHFFDSDVEPDIAVIRAYKRPSVEFLAKNPDVVAKLYKNYDVPMFQRLYQSYEAGPVNVFPARNALLYQSTTKLMSYIMWFILAVIIYIRRRNQRAFIFLNIQPAFAWEPVTAKYFRR